MKLKFPGNPAAFKKLLGQYKYVLLVIFVGILLLTLPTGSNGEKDDGATTQLSDTGFDLAAFEGQLEKILSQIEGAGTATVLLTLKNDGLRVIAEDMEQGKDGNLSVSAVTVSRGSGTQGVIELQSITPQFQGALVVCPGGEDPEVQLRLMEAVSALTGLGSNKISICKGN